MDYFADNIRRNGKLYGLSCVITIKSEIKKLMKKPEGTPHMTVMVDYRYIQKRLNHQERI